MAAPSFSDLAQDDLSCPVCCELLRDPNTPKELDCSHVCCALCIQKMTEGGKLTVDCPECRYVTRIPKDEVTAMKTNFRLRSLAEKHEDHMNKRQEIKDATNLCSEHNIIIDFFCTKCLFAGCSTCMLNKHKGTEHDTMNIASVHREQKEQLKTVFQQMDSEIQECVDNIKDLDTLQESMESFLEKQRQYVRKQLEITIKKVKDDAHLIEQQLDSIEQPKIAQVRGERDRLQAHMHEIKELKSSVQNTVDNCPSHEYVEQHAALVESVTRELGQDVKAPTDLDPVIGKARFQIAASSGVILGTVPQIKKCKLTENQELGIIWCRDNRSVAATIDGFLVVCVDRGLLCIYRRQLNGEYKKKKSITLSKKVTAKSPTCIAVSADGKFLVARGVWLELYSFTGEYEGTFDFKPGLSESGKNICKNLRPNWVFIEKDIGLLVGDWVNSNIVHFSHDGIFMDAIPVPHPIRCITSMSDGLIAASNWRKSKVLIIDIKSKQTVSTLEIENANAICFHEKSDTLLVGRCLKRQEDGNNIDVDGSTGVIEQYCLSTGTLVARIFERRDGAHSYPQDIILTHDGRLIVADLDVVRVFDITC